MLEVWVWILSGSSSWKLSWCEFGSEDRIGMLLGSMIRLLMFFFFLSCTDVLQETANYSCQTSWLLVMLSDNDGCQYWWCTRVVWIIDNWEMMLRSSFIVAMDNFLKTVCSTSCPVLDQISNCKVICSAVIVAINPFLVTLLCSNLIVTLLSAIQEDKPRLITWTRLL